MKKIVILFIFLYFNTITMRSQVVSGHQKTTNDSTGNKHLDFIYFPNKNSQNYLIAANLQLMVSPIGKSLGGNGIVPNFGINLGRLFSRKIILGITFEWKIIGGIFPEKTSKEFASAFNSAYIDHYSTPKDSANAFVVKAAINGNFLGSQQGNIGIMFSLFPQKYGGILVQLKRGYRGFEIHSNVNGNKYIEDGGRDYYTLYAYNTWSCELSVKPLAFFRNTYIPPLEGSKKTFLNRLIFSVYFEKLDFRTARFNGTMVKDMVNDSFMKKYGIDNRFGFKLGIAIY